MKQEKNVSVLHRPITRSLFMACLLLLATATTVAAQTNSEERVRFSEKRMSLIEAFRQIERQTQWTVAYNEVDFDVDSQVSTDVEGDVSEVMPYILQSTDMTHKIEGQKIVIIKSDDKRRVIDYVGFVCDEAGEPLVGVTVVGDDNALGTISDLDGKFYIKAAEASQLTLSYVGYKSTSVLLSKNADLRIVMEENLQELEEVFVIGYGTAKRKDITTAVSVVSVKDFDERPVVSAAQAAAGKVAGVQITQPSGAPGAGLSIRVRGATSIQASNEPLYVVDGVPMDDISNLSPNDIESMQILKDASSASIYGARAANGVVLITTKRGGDGKRQIKFSAYAGISQLGNRIDALDTEQYKSLMKDLGEITTTVPIIPDSEKRYTNWTDEFFKIGVDQNYQLSLQSGNDKLQYYVSGGYTDQTGIVQKAGYRRYNLRANVSSQHYKWLRVALNTAYTHSDVTKVYESRSALRAGSILSVINTPPFMQVWDPNNPEQYDENAYGARIMNPIAANATDQKGSTDRFITALNLEIRFMEGLKFKSNLSLDLMNDKSSTYLDPTTTNDGRSTKGYASEYYGKNVSYLMENLLSYERTIKDHSFSVLAGSTIEKAVANWGNMAGFDFLAAYPDITGIAGANQIKTDETYGGETSWSLASFLARATYNYKSKYLATVNVRADGSSRFAPGHRWGYFPSASVGWRMSSEPFMADASDWLDDLKIRAGWGVNGNQGGIGNFSYLAHYYASRVAPTTDNQLPGYAITPNTAANPNLTWEKTTQSNVGIDATFFGSRLNFSADFYHKKTTDLLLTVYLPNSVNLPGGITRNDGAMLNRGMEFLINSVNIRNKDFEWDTNFNISFNQNKILDLGLNTVYYYAGMYTTGQDAVIVTEGVPLGTFYGYISEGVDPETGDLIYTNVDDSNDKIDHNDRTVIGCAQPIFTCGMTNTFTYRGLSLSFFLQGSYGNDIFNASKIDMEQMLDFRNQSTSVLRRWQRPGQITDMPRVGNVENIYNSTRFVEDGSYLRLKNLTLSYNIQSAALRRANINSIKPYVTANNLFTLTRYSGYDPEVNAYGGSAVALGVDYGTYPQSRTFIFGLNVEF